MTPVEEVCAEFERLETLLATYNRPDHRTSSRYDECAEVLALSSAKLKPYLTPTQVAQLDHAYWHFMDTTAETYGEMVDGKINGNYLEDLCQSIMHFGHDVIKHPDKYPAH